MGGISVARQLNLDSIKIASMAKRLATDVVMVYSTIAMIRSSRSSKIVRIVASVSGSTIPPQIATTTRAAINHSIDMALATSTFPTT